MSAAWTVRPVAAEDLPALSAWLPPGSDRTVPSDDPAQAWWLAIGRHGPAAVLRLRGPIGLDQPRHWYHLGCVVHAAPELALFSRQGTLLLGNDHTGASELADAAHHPALDTAGQAAAWQALLAAARDHLRRHRARHGGSVVCTLPGLRDAQGASPFWTGLGRAFYAGDVDALLAERGLAARADLAALLPRQVVYTGLLPAALREAVAQAAPPSRGWMDSLAHAGFRFSHHVDIIDGGPVFEAHTDTWCAQD